MGQSILESYSRVLESLAFNLMARIIDLLYVDDATKQRAMAGSISMPNQRGLSGTDNVVNQKPRSSFSKRSFSSSSDPKSPVGPSFPLSRRSEARRRSFSRPTSGSPLHV